MKGLSIHIVEDEIIIAMDLEEMLKTLGHRVADISMSYNDVLEKIDSGDSNLFLVDIQIKGEKSGIDVAKELNKRNIPHIYISSHKDEAILSRAKKTNAYGYILKPFDLADIFVALEMASGRMSIEKTKKTAIINDGKRKYIVSFEDIMYAEADGNYTHIYTVERKHTLRSNLKTTHEEVLNGLTFMRVHKSYVVNELFIKKILKTHVVLNTGKMIPLGKKSSQNSFENINYI